MIIACLFCSLVLTIFFIILFKIRNADNYCALESISTQKAYVEMHQLITLIMANLLFFVLLLKRCG